MEFVVNDSHKKMIINRDIRPTKVDCHIGDNNIHIDLYSGCVSLNSIEEITVDNRDKYDIYYDKSSDLFVFNDIETDNVSCVFSSIYKANLDEVKRR